MRSFLLKPTPRTYGVQLEPTQVILVVYHRGWLVAQKRHPRDMATLTTVRSLSDHTFVAPSYRILLHQISLIQRNLSLPYTASSLGESYKQTSMGPQRLLGIQRLLGLSG